MNYYGSVEVWVRKASQWSWHWSRDLRGSRWEGWGRRVKQVPRVRCLRRDRFRNLGSLWSAQPEESPFRPGCVWGEEPMVPLKRQLSDAMLGLELIHCKCQCTGFVFVLSGRQLHCLPHSANASVVWVRLVPGAGNSIHVLHVDGRNPLLPLSAALERSWSQAPWLNAHPAMIVVLVLVLCSWWLKLSRVHVGPGEQSSR